MLRVFEKLGVADAACRNTMLQRVKLLWILTIRQYPQMPHLDLNETLPWQNKTWFLHMPLQSEGMTLIVYDEDYEEHKTIFVPFGTCILLRSDVIHAGVFGGGGNLRLHLILWKVTPAGTESDILIRRPDLYTSSKQRSTLDNTNLRDQKKIGSFFKLV